MVLTSLTVKSWLGLTVSLAGVLTICTYRNMRQAADLYVARPFAADLPGDADVSKT